MSCKLQDRPGLFGKSPFSRGGLFYFTDAVGTMRAIRRSFAFAAKPHIQGAVAAFRNNKLRDLFQAMHAGERSNGARYDAFYDPQSIQKDFVACKSA